MLKSRIVIEEDTFSEYLTFIYDNFHKNLPTELKHLARTMVGEEEDDGTGFIPKFISTTFNPNLFISGQEEEYWQLKSSQRSNVIGGGNLSSIEVIYTGMRLHENLHNYAKVWTEFAGDDGMLERDYAFYQETGMDTIADSSDAKHKGGIRAGVMASSDTLFNHTAEYVYNIMRRGDGNISPKLI